MPKTNVQQPVYLSMTGEEFKKLIEQRDENGVINTLQEILKAFEGIGDNETIADFVIRMLSEDENITELIESRVTDEVNKLSAEDKDIADLFIDGQR